MTENFSLKASKVKKMKVFIKWTVLKINSRLIKVFIANRLIINSDERVIPDWDIRKIRRLFFEIETRPNFNQFNGKRLIYTISSEAASLTFRLPVISRLAFYVARKKSRKGFHFPLLLESKYF